MAYNYYNHDNKTSENEQLSEKILELIGNDEYPHSPICIPCTGKTQQVILEENADRKAVNIIFPPQGDCSNGRIIEVNVALPALIPERLVNVAVILKESQPLSDEFRVLSQRITTLKVSKTGIANVPKFTFVVPESEGLKSKRTFFVDVAYHYSGVVD